MSSDNSSEKESLDLTFIDEETMAEAPTGGKKKTTLKRKKVEVKPKMKVYEEACLEFHKQFSQPSKGKLSLKQFDEIHKLMNEGDVKQRCKAAFVLPLMKFLGESKLMFEDVFFDEEKGNCSILIHRGEEVLDRLKTTLPLKVYATCRMNFGKIWWKISKGDLPKAQNALNCSEEHKGNIILYDYHVVQFEVGERCIMPHFRYEPYVFKFQNDGNENKRRKKKEDDKPVVEKLSYD